MSESDQAWLTRGRGLAPEWQWSFTADAPLVGLELARETGETFVADAAGSVYLIDRRGRVVTLTRGLPGLQEIAWSDAGTGGAVVGGDSTLTLLNRQLRVVWTTDLRQSVAAIAVDPFGHHIAVCFEGGSTRILNSNRKLVAEFQTTRPLAFVRFVTTVPELISAADNGLICRHQLTGSQLWGEAWWSNIGDLCITGDGEAIFLAGLNMGVQRFDADGNSQGTYVIDGTPNRIATSFALRRLAVATVENSLAWLDADGEILWMARTPEPVQTLRCDPIGSGMVCGFESGRVARLEWGAPIV
jgi:hypothetical protein